MGLETAVLLMMVWAAPGDIHRCVDAQGVVQFRDQPCESGAGAVFRNDADANPDSTEDLRRWLQGVNAGDRSQAKRRAAARPRPTLVLPPLGLAERPEGSRTLATCSARFFECTNGNSVQMDQCVSRIQSCSAKRRSQCCHSAFVSRYEQLRTAGIGRHAAVRVLPCWVASNSGFA